jgi:23S rRNA (adenine2503-C2)-methyltransferase
MEATYINNGTGKDIICLPSQTGCNGGCKFCYLTKYGASIPVRHITYTDLCNLGHDTYIKQNLYGNDRPLLFSFMGVGDPLYNTSNVCTAIEILYDKFKFLDVRFAISSMFPSYINWELIKLFRIGEKVKLKLHASLHSSIHKVRLASMPRSSPIKDIASVLRKYREVTGNKVEFIYTLMNIGEDEARGLTKLWEEYNIPFRFTPLSTMDNTEVDAEKLASFFRILDDFHVGYKRYTPPGKDIGSSCGSFNINEYTKFYRDASYGY